MFKHIISLAQSIGSRIGSITGGHKIVTQNPDITWITYQVIPYQFHRVTAQSMQKFFVGCQQQHIIHTWAIHHQHHTQLYIRIPQHYQAIAQDLMYHCRGQTECVPTQIIIPQAHGRIHAMAYDHIPDHTTSGVGLSQIINISNVSQPSRTLIDINPKTHHITPSTKKKTRRSHIFDTHIESDTHNSSANVYDLKIRYSFVGSDEYGQYLSKILQQYSKYPVSIAHTSKRSGISYELISQVVKIPDADMCQTLSYISYRKLAYPANLPRLADQTDKNQITLLGSTEYRNQHQHFGILMEDKLKHMYIVGKTGTGKSTLISQMVKSDMVTNKGLCLIDPHGDLIQTVLKHVPSYRINDVILFDVADQNFPVGFNLLYTQNEQEQNLTVSGLVTTFKKLYGNSRGPRLEYILRISLLTIIKYPHASLIHLTKVLTDKTFRTQVLSYVKDPLLLNFWQDEFDKRPDRLRDESISPILNKVGQFLSSPVVRNIFGQTKSNLDLRQIMDQGKILLVNLSKGQIGEDNCDMIGSFLVSKFQIDALSRADANYDQRRDFYLYIDEFQNFATDSFATIFSEARKYKLSLIVANQYIDQLTESLRNAIFGNVGSIISFTLGYDDAVAIKSQFKDLVSEHDLQNLPKFHAYIRMMIQGTMSDPFSMSTFPLKSPPDDEQHVDKIRQQSRQRYALTKTIAQQQLQDDYQLLSKNKKKQSHLNKKKPNQTLHQTSRSDLAPTLTEQKNITSTQEQQNYNMDAKVGEVTISDLVNKEIVSIQDLGPGKTYTGVIKLKYNYGLFVVVGKVEGLLHKSKIITEDRKRNCHIGDTIDIALESTLEKDGITKAIRTQTS